MFFFTFIYSLVKNIRQVVWYIIFLNLNYKLLKYSLENIGNKLLCIIPKHIVKHYIGLRRNSVAIVGVYEQNARILHDLVCLILFLSRNRGILDSYSRVIICVFLRNFWHWAVVGWVSRALCMWFTCTPTLCFSRRMK